MTPQGPSTGPTWSDRAGESAATRDERVLDRIQLRGLTVFGRHGVLAAERAEGQAFVVDAVLHVDTRRAAVSDDLADTVDYGTLAVRLADAVRDDPVDLLETLAARLADICLADPRVAAADVTVHKPQAPIPEVFADVGVTVHRRRPEAAGRAPTATAATTTAAGEVPVVLALGANLGDRAATLRSAVAALRRLPGLRLRAVSPVVESAPVGGVEQSDYLNAVVLADTSLGPWQLLGACQGVEAAHGRVRTVRWGERTLDVDVISYGDLTSTAPDLLLPHPRARERAFVLVPWVLADPRASLTTPDGPVAVADLARQVGVGAAPVLRADLSLEG